MIDDMRAKAADALMDAKREIEQSGNLNPYFEIKYGGEWHRFPMPEGTARLMNLGPAKDFLFGFLRQVVEAEKAEAFLSVTDTWTGIVTEEGMKHTDEEREQNTDSGFVKLLSLGWVERYEALNVLVQDAENALMYHRAYRRAGDRIEWTHGPVDLVVPQKEFSGRLKMFGEMATK